MTDTTTMTNMTDTAARVPSPPLNYDYSVITSDTDSAATLLLDAKNEYNKQLTSHLRQPVFSLMKSIYNTAEDICHQENTPENVLMVFQDNLAQVPKWAKSRRTREYDEFLKVSKCDWFNELIKFCYITHVKILTIVNKPRPDVKLSISIPSGGAFFHSVCVAVARELWRSPFLFNKNVGGKYEYQKNMRQIEQIIDNSVDSCIRAHIPMKAILHEYLDTDVSQPSLANLPKQPPIEPEPKTKTESFTPDKTGPIKEDTTPTIKPSSRLTKPATLKISDELDEFIDTPETTIDQTKTPVEKPSFDDGCDIGSMEDGLESVSFTKSDEVEDELEIIEPMIDDDSTTNPTTPVSMTNEDVELSDLREVILEQPTTKPKTPALLEPTEPESANPESANPKSNIEEFDIDALPEISLTDLTQIASVNKPSTPEPNTSADTAVPDNQMNNQTDIKHIPLTDMNEPGNQPGQIIQQELKQPITKKKVIVEELGIDGLDEVPLAARIEEMRTFKQPSTALRNAVPTSKQEFAFF